MIITTQRSRAGDLFDFVLTAFGWFAFVALIGAGILAILRGAASGPDAPLLPVFLPTVQTLWGYAVLAVVNAAVLVAWAVYNHRRFGGKDRRKPIRPLTDQRLAKSFEVSADQLTQLRATRVAVIHHGNAGQIDGIEHRLPRLQSLRAG